MSTCVDNEETTITGFRGTPSWTALEVGSPNGIAMTYSAIWADWWSCGRMLQHFSKTFPICHASFDHVCTRLLDSDPSRWPLLDTVVKKLRSREDKCSADKDPNYIMKQTHNILNTDTYIHFFSVICQPQFYVQGKHKPTLLPHLMYLRSIVCCCFVCIVFAWCYVHVYAFLFYFIDCVIRVSVNGPGILVYHLLDHPSMWVCTLWCDGFVSGLLRFQLILFVSCLGPLHSWVTLCLLIICIYKWVLVSLTCVAIGAIGWSIGSSMTVTTSVTSWGWSPLPALAILPAWVVDQTTLSDAFNSQAT